MIGWSFRVQAARWLGISWRLVVDPESSRRFMDLYKKIPSFFALWGQETGWVTLLHRSSQPTTPSPRNNHGAQQSFSLTAGPRHCCRHSVHGTLHSFQLWSDRTSLPKGIPLCPLADLQPGGEERMHLQPRLTCLPNIFGMYHCELPAARSMKSLLGKSR